MSVGRRSVSLTETIKNGIRHAILRGEFQEGDKIHTEKELCMKYGVSRITVQNAVLALVNEGVLYRIRGRGTFVKMKKFEWRFMMQDTSFNQQIREAGQTPASRVLTCETVDADAQLAREMKLGKDLRIIHLLRLRYADGKPVAIVESYLPYDLCAFILECDLEHDSLHETLNKREETRIMRIIRYVEAIAATDSERMMLSVPKGSPIHFFTNYAYNRYGRIVDYCRSYYRGDKSKFQVEIIPANVQG